MGADGASAEIWVHKPGGSFSVYLAARSFLASVKLRLVSFRFRFLARVESEFSRHVCGGCFVRMSGMGRPLRVVQLLLLILRAAELRRWSGGENRWANWQCSLQ